ncbi:SOS response-associated peptidase [Gorillibacterium sp. sgz5001074]|uniref:SOS response-associated peptidase n=1 Tax=Gorillibacterium sp. sgz5001074 TaxID=3446695 RepID=UPI003F675856
MCGRFSITVTIEELMERFLLEHYPDDIIYTPRYNAAPGQPVPAILAHEGVNRLGPLKWGLVPSWSKEEKPRFPTFNAKAETLLEKASFRLPFERKRCLIPADGFYEWQALPDGNKRPMRIVLKKRGLFAMAGLYDTWTAPDGRKVSSCTVITTEPNQLMSGIHNRMPVILRPEDEAFWLDRSRFDPERLQRLLVPYADGELEAYPVHPDVGSVKNDWPGLIEPYSADGIA